MSMGKRKSSQQEQMFLPTARGEGHRFYQALDKLLRGADCDAKVEALCEPHYAAADQPGRPSLAPGIFFRMMLVGYFEGIASERGICWRCADSISLRDFLGLANHVSVPDQSTVCRTRRRLPAVVFEEVLNFVLVIVAEQGLLKGRVRGVDSTYLQADASMKSIVRKDTQEDYSSYIRRLASEDGAEASVSKSDDDDEPPEGPSASGPSTEVPVTLVEPQVAPKGQATRTEAIRHDRKRKKRTSNRDWESPTDPDSRIARMKNGTTRLAYKHEHVVYMETGVILGVQVFHADRHDATTILESLAVAEENVARVGYSARVQEPFVGESWHREPLAEVVADKGYHKASTLRQLKEEGYRTLIPERKQRGRRHFVDKGGSETSRAFHENRARVQRTKSKTLQRRRGELVERPNQHLFDRTGLRNLPLTGLENVRKRVLLQSAAFNLSAVMRKRLGRGTPRSFFLAFLAYLASLYGFWVARGSWRRLFPSVEVDFRRLVTSG